MKELVFLIVLFLLLGFVMVRVRSTAKASGYRQGQIDALTGKICYKLEQQPDGSTIWTRIKE